MPSFDHLWLFWFIPLALLPILVRPWRRNAFSSLLVVPADRPSLLLSIGVKAMACIAIAAILIALSGPYVGGRMIERVGTGAQILILADRSGSMNDTFAGDRPDRDQESKASAATRLLADFVRRREHDLFGLAMFATLPIPVMPLTNHRDAILGAIDAVDRPGLGYTNVGRGLILALEMLRRSQSDGVRVILLVSDGAAVIDPDVQQRLRAGFAEAPVHLYWLFLRTAGGRGIYDVPDSPSVDNPRTMPERHLDLFFKSLGIPYRAFETDGADAVGQALAEIGRLEQAPLHYSEPTPRFELATPALILALIMTLLLTAALGSQVRFARHRPMDRTILSGGG
ncbi:mxaC protein [Arboricoccus pini]|uniref:MxaC protein n=1 Tax=Arboricoccus pini TaxID=1963835 RepID=A0A212R0I3_9PROT|nr:vWA domain-containing protein [Arboricoccus pini]SNB65510.1 mxaC protein [Arboricoccus pini]